MGPGRTREDQWDQRAQKGRVDQGDKWEPGGTGDDQWCQGTKAGCTQTMPLPREAKTIRVEGIVPAAELRAFGSYGY